MEIHQSAVILLLVLAASFTVYGQPDNIKPRYKNFLNQHLGPHVSEQDCDKEIRKRHITAGGTANDCKDVNTFIQANTNDINNVCGRGGRPYGNNKTISNQPFPVVTCKRKGGQRHPNCKYRGKRSTRYIVLGCEKGWPVHYDEGIINISVQDIAEFFLKLILYSFVTLQSIC